VMSSQPRRQDANTRRRQGRGGTPGVSAAALPFRVAGLWRPLGRPRRTGGRCGRRGEDRQLGRRGCARWQANARSRRSISQPVPLLGWSYLPRRPRPHPRTSTRWHARLSVRSGRHRCADQRKGVGRSPRIPP
jgi:hypothetical protein